MDRLASRLKKSGRKAIPLTKVSKIVLYQFELIIAQDIIDPEELSVELDMIGGLEKEKYEILV